MKFNKITESNFIQTNLDNHIDNHMRHYQKDPRFTEVIDDAELFKKLYDSIGDRLSRKHVDRAGAIGARYVGFIGKDGRRIKYDRKYKDFLVYDFDKTISLHKKSEHEYNRILKRDFFKEFPYNEAK